MAESWGTGVSRTLSAIERQFQAVIWQDGKPPLDSELNLMAQIDWERLANYVRSQMPSGWLIDPMRADDDYLTNKKWSNLFKLGKVTANNAGPVMWVNVNGWIVPIAGTSVSTDGDLTNFIKLNPPPATDQRADLVFLEVWQCAVAPNTSTANKPSATTIYKYGNTQYGGTNVTDDLEDPEIKFETTERVQVQYRIRVHGSGAGGGTNVTLKKYPAGLDDLNVYGQGAGASPQSTAAYRFVNQEDNGDPGLWRGGDGSTASRTALGTVDGYTYAIPLCAIFRRNSNKWQAVSAAGDPDQNGSVNRTPGAVDTTNAKELSKATLKVAMTEATTGSVAINSVTLAGVTTADSLTNTFLEDVSHGFTVNAPGYLRVGTEIIEITDASAGTITIPASGGRGRGGTQATNHPAGTEVTLYNVRPDALYSDEIAKTDILDLRHAVSPGEWDYQRLLMHNLGKLARGKLRSTWKQAAQGDAEGPLVPEVSYNLASGALNNLESVDGPDGIRSIFSDAACLQHDVTVLCHKDPNLTNGNTTTTFNLGASSTNWGIGADIKHFGFYNNTALTGYKNGTVIFMPVGGEDGESGAKAGFINKPASDPKAVRWVAPREYWKTDFADSTTGKQHPWTLRFLGNPSTNPYGPNADATGQAGHPGPMYPLKSANFERPFIVLGGVAHSSFTGVAARPVTNLSMVNSKWEFDTGIDFSTANLYFNHTSGVISNDPSLVTNPMLNGTRTLYGLLTNDGKDETGNSSELYCILWGDTDAGNEGNNGCFRIVGIGSSTMVNGARGLTTDSAASNTKIRMVPLTPGATQATDGGGSVSFEFRTQHMNANDGSGRNAGAGPAAACVVLTDIAGKHADDVDGKFGHTTLGSNYQLGGAGGTDPVDYHMVLNGTLLYGPGRGGVARVPETIHHVGTRSTPSTYLREAESAKDATFVTNTGGSSGESYYKPAHVQTWNRLPAKGLPAPDSPAQGGSVVSFSEQDREAELFVDEGSKTLVFRPYQKLTLTLQGNVLVAGAGRDVPAGKTLFGDANYGTGDTFDNNGIAKDAAGLFRAGHLSAFTIPPECMPKFGRQDIPYYKSTTGTFMPGYNHMFLDTGTNADDAYYIIGGKDNGAAPGVFSMQFDTGAGNYARWGTIAVNGAPAVPAYSARRTAQIGNTSTDEKAIRKALADVQSSDLGAGLSGIQLPPYLGVARLYGVYERADYIAKGGRTFTSDRKTAEADPATNLLKITDKQSLFIMQDGAKDLTGETGDHTYIVPSNVVDHTLVPGWTNQTFDSYDYVVECVVFGFAKNFINGNNYVLERKNDGAGNALAGGDEIQSVNMVLPWAAQAQAAFYTAYSRPVYQGDPFWSRSGSATPDVNDYPLRYGQLPHTAAWANGLSKSIQQFNPSTGALQVETPNPRALEVLSSVDFYTTLGTGKVGGAMHAGTGLDVGHTTNTAAAAQRWPATASANAKTFHHVDTRAFTAGQVANTSRATATLEVTSWADVFNTNGVVLTFKLGTTTATLTAVDAGASTNQFNDGASATESATNIAAAINLSTNAFKNIVTATSNGAFVYLTAVPTGAKGNEITVEVTHANASVEAADVIKLSSATTALVMPSFKVTKLSLTGGSDLSVNAGAGASQLELTGMTERLPLGILVQDSDFLCENPLGDNASAMRTSPSGMRPVQTALPLTANSGKEYSRFYGKPGELIGMCEGYSAASGNFEAYHSADRPAATKKFRLYRGGGAVYVLSGDNPGGPVDWASDNLPASATPVLKGGVLAGKALLVRNFKETPANGTLVHGNELQMVILTHAKFGDGTSTTAGVNIDGQISPTGYGEGYAAADRYRLEGKPLTSSHFRAPPDPNYVTNADFTLAPFPEK